MKSRAALSSTLLFLIRSSETTMKKNDTPYITLQEFLRDIAVIFGSKNALSAEKTIDDACKKKEIRLEHFEQLKEKLIEQPLRSSCGVKFSEMFMVVINEELSYYISFMKSRSLDGSDPDETKKILKEYFYTKLIIRLWFCGAGVIFGTPKEIIDSNKNALAVIFNELKKQDQKWSSFIQSQPKEFKNKILSWSAGRDLKLPTLKVISDIGGRDNFIFNKAIIFSARMFDYFFFKSNWSNLKEINNDKLPTQHELEEKLNRKLPELTRKFEDVSVITRELAENLLPNRKKTPEARQRCSDLLKQYEVVSQSIDCKDVVYFKYWMNGRYCLFSGDLNEALNHYILAFESSLYRSMRSCEDIIREAMMIASRVPTSKAIINRLRYASILFEFDIKPDCNDVYSSEFKGKMTPVEGWEIDAFAKDFERYFTPESFFYGVEYPQNPRESLGLFILDKKKKKVDIKNPNKEFTYRGNGERKKKLPQLVYFSMLNDLDSVSVLLDAGANVNRLSSDGESALLFSVRHEDSSVFDKLSSKKHDRDTINKASKIEKQTVLGEAVRFGDLKRVSKVIKLGADVNIRHMANETPLHTCLGLIGHFVKPDLSALKDPRLLSSDSYLNFVRTNIAGYVPHDKKMLTEFLSTQRAKQTHDLVLNMAHNDIVANRAISDYQDIACLLLDSGANPNKKCDTGLLGYTPFMLANELNELKLFIEMLEHGGDLNDQCVCPKTKMKFSHLDIARRWKSNDVLEVIEGYSSM